MCQSPSESGLLCWLVSWARARPSSVDLRVDVDHNHDLARGAELVMLAPLVGLGLLAWDFKLNPYAARGQHDETVRGAMASDPLDFAHLTRCVMTGCGTGHLELVQMFGVSGNPCRCATTTHTWCGGADGQTT